MLLVNYAECEQVVFINFTSENNRPSIEIVNNGLKEISLQRMSHSWQNDLVYSKGEGWIISTVPGGNALIETKVGPGDKIVLSDEFHFWNKLPEIGLKVGIKIDGTVVWSNEYAKNK